MDVPHPANMSNPHVLERLSTGQSALIWAMAMQQELTVEVWADCVHTRLTSCNRLRKGEEGGTETGYPFFLEDDSGLDTGGGCRDLDAEAIAQYQISDLVR